MPIQILMEATLTVVQCTVNAYYMEAQQHVSDPYAMQYKTLSHGMSIIISTKISLGMYRILASNSAPDEYFPAFCMTPIRLRRNN